MKQALVALAVVALVAALLVVERVTEKEKHPEPVDKPSVGSTISTTGAATTITVKHVAIGTALSIKGGRDR